MTTNKRLRLRYCTVEANYRHEASRDNTSFLFKAANPALLISCAIFRHVLELNSCVVSSRVVDLTKKRGHSFPSSLPLPSPVSSPPSPPPPVPFSSPFLSSPFLSFPFLPSLSLLVLFPMQLRGLGSTVSSPSRVRSGAPAANKFCGYFKPRKRVWW